MFSKHLAFSVVGLFVMLKDPQRRNERGISQSAESAILLAGAVGIALVVVALITSFVKAKLKGI
jgi:hypothetical protein